MRKAALLFILQLVQLTADMLTNSMCCAEQCFPIMLRWLLFITSSRKHVWWQHTHLAPTPDTLGLCILHTCL